MKAMTDKQQGVTDEAVEAVARVIYERKVGLSWWMAPEDLREEWRDIARAGLQAAGTIAVVHLCATCAQSMCRRRRDIEDACEDPLLPARAVVVECKAYVAQEDVQEVAEGG